MLVIFAVSLAVFFYAPEKEISAGRCGISLMLKKTLTQLAWLSAKGIMRINDLMDTTWDMSRLNGFDVLKQYLSCIV